MTAAIGAVRARPAKKSERPLIENATYPLYPKWKSVDGRCKPAYHRPKRSCRTHPNDWVYHFEEDDAV